MNAVDSAIIRGRVVGDPQYVKNDGLLRCIFMLGLEIKHKRLPEGAPIESQVKYFGIRVVAESDLTERCRTLLESGDEVIAFGDFGFHKGVLKMRLKKISLPQVPAEEGIPTA